MKFNKWIAVMLISMFIFGNFIYIQPVSAAAPVESNLYAQEVPISAQTASVIDVQSGRILYGKDMNKKMRIASLTKVVTAIVAIESGELNDVVTVSRNAAGTEGSSIYLAVGEKQKLIDLVYGLMLRSGNDSAVAIAEHVGGSVEGFAKKMNQLAQKLGLEGTHFMNPHGLDHDDHYSTAHDMAVLTAYALRNPIFAEIVKTKVKKIPWPGQEWERTLYNKNKMLSRYDGADGVKTGYTKKAGRCLISSATKNGRQVAVVVLNDGRDWDDSARLLNYGFTTYQPSLVVEQNKPIATVPVRGGKELVVPVVPKESLNYPVREGERSRIRQEISLKRGVYAPIDKGEEVGTLTLYFDQEKIGTVPLITSERIEDNGLWARVKAFLLSLFGA